MPSPVPPADRRSRILSGASTEWPLPDGGEAARVASGLSSPTSVAVDSRGDLYIAGAGYSTITRLSPRDEFRPVSLRGSFLADTIAVADNRDIYFTADEGRRELRALRKITE